MDTVFTPDSFCGYILSRTNKYLFSFSRTTLFNGLNNIDPLTQAQNRMFLV